MELSKAFRLVIDYLDQKMNDEPTRELADASNLLENELTKLGE